MTRPVGPEPVAKLLALSARATGTTAVREVLVPLIFPYVPCSGKATLLSGYKTTQKCVAYRLRWQLEALLRVFVQSGMAMQGSISFVLLCRC